MEPETQKILPPEDWGSILQKSLQRGLKNIQVVNKWEKYQVSLMPPVNTAILVIIMPTEPNVYTVSTAVKCSSLSDGVSVIGCTSGA